MCLKKSKKNLLSLGYRYKYLCVQIPEVRCTSKNWDGKSFGESEHGDLALKKRCYVNPSTSNLSREDRRTSLISGRIAFVLLVRTSINSYFENKLLRVLNLFWSFNLAPSEKEMDKRKCPSYPWVYVWSKAKFNSKAVTTIFPNLNLLWVCPLHFIFP